MKAIHGAKTQNDKIDSKKIAMLLRGGLIPMAYVYPQHMRSNPDLLRRRMYFSHKRSVKSHNYNDFYLLKTVPGVGDILAMVILYEIHDISRFQRVQNFTSYARLVKPKKESAGNLKGGANGKIGNAYLKWVSEMTEIFQSCI
jgi:hypothetical protein